MTVIDREEQFRQIAARNRYAKLSAICERHKAAVEADPWPFIRQLEDRVHELVELVDAVDEALTPPIQIIDHGPIEYVDPLVEEMKRADAARELLRDWRTHRRFGVKEEDDAPDAH